MDYKECVKADIDNLIIFFSSWNEYVKHLESVLDSKMINFSVNIREFLRSGIQLLVPIVGSKNVPDPENITEIKNLETSKIKKDAIRDLSYLTFLKVDQRLL